jgi:hypothetical protein
MKKITKQGIYRGLSYEEYNSINALRSTYLKKHLLTPAHCLIQDEDSAALRFGIAAHAYTLEGPDVFASQYYVMNEIPEPVGFMGKRWKLTAEYQKQKKAHEEEAALTGKKIISEEDFNAIVTMKKNILLHPTAKLLMKKVEPEVVCVVKDKETGLLYKVRLDIAPYEGMDVIPDYKTCEDASEFGFKRSIENYHYDFSMAMYLEAASIAFKKEINLGLWIAAEKSKPHRVQVHEMGKNRLERASAKFHEALRAELACQKSGVWPAFLDGGVYVQD